MELDALKAALREQNKELQKREAERKALEKEKVEGALRVKEVEHKIAKFHKDSREATQRVSQWSDLSFGRLFLRIFQLRFQAIIEAINARNLLEQFS